jgi:hypothetical protein
MLRQAVSKGTRRDSVQVTKAILDRMTFEPPDDRGRVFIGSAGLILGCWAGLNKRI